MPGVNRKCTKLSNESCMAKLAEYFERVEGQIKCKIIDCKSSVSRFTSYYLKRHLRSRHQSIFKRLFEDELEHEILQAISFFETKQSAVELVTSDGYPMSLLNKPAFRYLIGPRLDCLAENGFDITINRSVITGHIAETSDGIKERIKNELKNVRLFSVMMDVATKLTLSVLGINISFTRNDVVAIRSLGVIQLTKRHTAENLAELFGQ